MEALQVRNRMTATQLVENCGGLKFIANPKRPGHYFFTTPTIERGYISPKIVAKIDSVELSEMQFAECRKPGEENWVPCLMMVGDSDKNTVRSW